MVCLGFCYALSFRALLRKVVSKELLAEYLQSFDHSKDGSYSSTLSLPGRAVWPVTSSFSLPHWQGIMGISAVSNVDFCQL